MKQITTLVIGAGQAGLAISALLQKQGIDHIIIERGQIANSWRQDRWDSLRLLTPNWQSRLPGHRYDGPEPDGYMSMPEVTGYLQSYAEKLAAPVQEYCQVLSVSQASAGYIVRTTNGDWHARHVVLANGACGIANVPAMAADLPSHIRQETPISYKNPDQLPIGKVLVIGGSATGVQLAREINASGRPVILALGEHLRVPRRYRGRDIEHWMDRSGLLDLTIAEVDDLNRARRAPSPQLVGDSDLAMLDINLLQEEGVEIVGRLAALRGGKALFSGGLANAIASSDLKMNRLLTTIDDYIKSHGLADLAGSPDRPVPAVVPASPRLQIDLAAEGIGTILWATGYRPDYSWLKADVFDHKGRLRYDGGIVAARGLYALGLNYMRRKKSLQIDGVGDDAADLMDHMLADLDGRMAA